HDIATARRLAKDGDVVRVSAKGLDIVTYPLQTRDGVHGTPVATGSGASGSGLQNRRVIEPAQTAQPVVHRHDHDVLRLGQVASIVVPRVTTVIAATKNPVHHWQGLALGNVGGRIDTQIQAILTAHDTVVIGIRDAG